MAITETGYTLKTTVYSDGDKTFEVKRELEGVQGADQTMIVITERPVLGHENVSSLDSSWLHLQNHMKELGIGTIRLVNLLAKVWPEKPFSRDLKLDEANLSYIEEMLKDPADGVVLAWGNSFSSNLDVAKTKLAILKLLKDKKVKNVYHLIADGLDPVKADAVHPLYLGLRYGRKRWKLENYQLSRAIVFLESQIKVKSKPAPKKAKPKKTKEKESDEIQVEVLSDVLATG